MSESNNVFKTNQLDSVQTSLVCLIESEAEAMGNNPHAKRIREACDKLFRWGSAARRELTLEERAILNAMSIEEIIAAIAAHQPQEAA